MDSVEVRAIGSVVRRAHAFDGLAEAAAVLDASGIIVETNEAWRLFSQLNDGVPGTTGVGVDYVAVCERAAEAGAAPEARRIAEGLQAILAGERRHLDLEYRADSASEDRWYLIQASALPGTDGAGAVVVHQNITARKLLELGVVSQSDVDPVSGLPDWPAAVEFLSERLVAATTTGGRVTAMLVDVDRFATINDRLGWAAGNAVLVQLGARARRVVRPGDLLCRVGGDRFLIAFRDLRVVDVDPIRARLRDTLSQPFQVGTTEIDLVASLGVVASSENDTVDSLLARVTSEVRRQKAADRPEPVCTDSTYLLDRAETAAEQVIEDRLAAGRAAAPPTADDERTPERVDEQSLASQALHVALSVLPDRRILVDGMDEVMRGLTAEDPPSSVLLVDIGSIDRVKEAFGHEVGDRLILRCAHSLQLAAHGDDLLARFSDRTFGIFCTHLGTDELAMEYAARLREMVSRPVTIDGRDLEVTASIGMAATDSGATGALDLLQQADTALASVRGVSGGASRVYDQALRRQVLRQLDVEAVVRQTLDAGTVELAYQPIIRLEDDAIRGAEALLRLHDASGAAIDALEVIAAAERTGTIGQLSDLILRVACRDAVSWGGIAPGRTVVLSINLPGSALARPEFPAEASAIAAHTGIDPVHVCFELNESVLMEDAVRASRQLVDLKVRGFRLAADDFGTGYSSLAHLKRFPLDDIKIDGSLVHGLAHSLEDTAIVRAIMGVCDALGLAVVAEGVEDVDQLRELRRLGVSYGQGYLWSRAVPVSDFAELLVADRERLDVGIDLPARPPHTPHLPAAGPAPGAQEGLDTVLSVLAHELRTPLSVVTGYASLLESSLEPEQAEAAATIGRAGLRINRILTDIVDAGTVNDGSLRLQVRELDLADLVGRLVADLASPFAQVVTYTPPIARYPRVLADQSRIEQTLNNLVTNAVKFSPSGSPVDVSVQVEADWIDVSVTDEGPGVPPEQIGLIFRKYGRANSRVAGTGLGLYLARSIARAHGGEVLYRRRTDRIGSVFVLRLPRVATD
ncbi:MAG: Signaling protein ykoW [Acidimicrobiales bacterium]|nr:Signaling protein ykoW [Acidimicrobiales bacterium]